MTEKQLLELRDAEYVETLLAQAGWSEVIVPQLIEERKHLCEVLISTTLNRARTSALPGLLPEEIAGRISGIDFLQTLIRDILKRKEKILTSQRTSAE
jgi:hypothetical protein